MRAASDEMGSISDRSGNTRLIRQVTWILVGVVIIRTAGGILLLYPVYVSNPDIQLWETIGIIYHALGSSMYVIMAWACHTQAWKLVIKLEQALELVATGSKKQQYQQLLDVTRKTIKATYSHCIVGGIQELILVCWPWLRAKGAYVMAWIWLTSVISSNRVIVAASVNNGSSTDQQRVQPEPSQQHQHQQQQQQIKSPIMSSRRVLDNKYVCVDQVPLCMSPSSRVQPSVQPQAISPHRLLPLPSLFHLLSTLSLPLQPPSFSWMNHTVNLMHENCHKHDMICSL